ncbi:acyltransferase domain-containing protein [Lipingzhangella sp. LS1_29]|uniref:Acyltransferase domain-containing protein n=1 Tax=Lipingzhangella rawalii TaxID=2055835 RepID=A0ABU2H1H5_9ACTN|nr:acyltransferase domain-containing protein [Lipingzhangella rawalii]MDS1269146.1 acyltransferase domain-containing protein [Lipingzhangella rawalii]
MDVDHLHRSLGLAEEHRSWLSGLAALADTNHSVGGGLVLPPPEQAATALAPFALQPEDERELCALWPDESWPPEFHWLLQWMYQRIIADLGTGQWRGWPTLTEVDDARVRCMSVFAFAAAVPALREWHARHGVPPAVTAATLADVGRHVAKNRAMFGRCGLEVATWIALHFRGGLFELGRLQYEPAQLGPQAAVTWYTPQQQAHLPRDLHTGQPVLRLHIPETGPLDEQHVTDSLRQARGFFATHFATDYPVATCTSWLLDPQLAAYLPAESNILAFQRRFTLVPHGTDGNADVFRFVFRRHRVDPDTVEPRSTLERTIIDHLRNGGHWQVRTGWLRLPE